jgi:SOS-response transcriptional repressor LexA
LPELSEPARRVLEAVIDFVKSGRPPTYAELSRSVARSPKAIQEQIDRLEERGYIKREAGARGIQPLKFPDGSPYQSPATRRRDTISLGATILPAARLDPKHRRDLDALARAYYQAKAPVTAAAVSRQMNTDIKIAARRLAPLVATGFASHENGRYALLRRADGSPALPLPPARQTARTEEPANPVVQLLEHAIALVGEPDVIDVPVLGLVAAGRAVEAVHDDPERMAIPAEWARGERLYLLRVTGDSMFGKPDWIRDGDYLLVRAQDHAEPGAVHVIYTANGAIVKRVESAGERNQYVSNNAEYAPIPASEGDILQGRVVKVIRDLE